MNWDSASSWDEHSNFQQTPLIDMTPAQAVTALASNVHQVINVIQDPRQPGQLLTGN